MEELKRGVSKEEFLNLFAKDYEGFDFDALFDILTFQGLPLTIIDDKIYLKTAITPYDEYEYVILDLEVNNSKPQEGQIIEIGAVKLKNLQVVDMFSSLIYAPNVPAYVTKITGIDEEMLKDKNSQKKVLEDFRLFLKDSVIVAHDALFDVKFLANQFEKEGLGTLLNRSLCTITLAKKTIEASRYGLKYLKEELNLSDEVDHRALADAKTTTNLFLKALENLPSEIVSTEDLIEFATPKVKKKR
jgi:DNA polymerase-3 subunit epsilon